MIIFLKNAKKVNIASKADQDHFKKLIAHWTVCCLRPFIISEVEELQCAFDFATSVGGKLKLPSRNTNKIIVDDLANET